MAEDTSHSRETPSTSEKAAAQSHPEETAPDPEEDDLDDLDGEGLGLQPHFHLTEASNRLAR